MAAADQFKSCTNPSLEQRGLIHLPVLADHSPRGTIRKSKNGVRRAWVLGIIQLLLIVHIVLWVLSKKFGWWGGNTLTPLEPSESMEFVKNGVINAGLILFSLALLSTLVLGRWFCGWGCHVVMLQDFCGWMMKKCGVRPKAFRSRVLIYVPLLLAVYMFIMPAVHRWGLIPLDGTMARSLGEDHVLVTSVRWMSGAIGFPLPLPQIQPWQATTHLTTDEFWKTFPGVMMAIPFLFICGFATVYFLGAKGFCTYGCPYGGFFTPLDRLAPARIIVTDACEGCGHCTAVCTSNVRVHEEVREYGMVVNPGCMKCLDCVSVCPKEALYFGFARPSILKGAPKNAAPKRIYDLTLGEELAMALVFTGVFLAFRGDLLRFPLLMAGGVAGVMTFIIWKLWRMVRDANVTLHRYQFKIKGSVKVAGWVFALLGLAATVVVANAGMVNGAYAMGQWHASKVTLRPDITFSSFQQPLAADMAVHADKALWWFRASMHIGDDGIGLFRVNQAEPELASAKLLSEKLEFDKAEQLLRRAIERDGTTDRMLASLLWALEAQGRRVEAIELGKPALLGHADFNDTLETFKQLALRDNNGALLEEVFRGMIDRHGVSDLLVRDLMLVMYLNARALEALDYGDVVLQRHEELPRTLDFYRRICADLSQPERTIAMCRSRLERFPDHLYTLRILSMVLLEYGDIAQSVEVTRRTLEIDPANASGRYFLAMGLAQMNQREEAVKELQTAIAQSPDSIPMHALMVELLTTLGRDDEAKVHREAIERLQAEHAQRAAQQNQPTPN